MPDMAVFTLDGFSLPYLSATPMRTALLFFCMKIGLALPRYFRSFCTVSLPFFAVCCFYIFFSLYLDCILVAYISATARVKPFVKGLIRY